METENKPVEQKPEATDTKQAFVLCPCCGKPTLTRPVKINDELLDHYMSCIISGVPFSHTYPIYGGRIKITVSQLDEPMIQALRKTGRILDTWSSEEDHDKEVFQELDHLIKLYCAITSISVSAGATTKELQPYNVVMSICKTISDYTETSGITKLDLARKQLETMRSPQTAAGVPAAIVMGVIEAHQQIYNILLNAGFDVNFWEGIELA